MSPVRVLAALVTLVVLAGTAFAAASLPSGEPQLPSSASRSWTETTDQTDSAVVVAAAVPYTLSPAEKDLTEAALARSTTTTSSTTTTTPTTTTTVAPTTTAQAKPSKSTSPPTTKAPQPPPAPKQKAGYSSKAESGFASSINSYRQSKGLSALARDGSLDSYARAWAKRLAERGSLAHSNIGSLLSPWQTVGENVGMGGSVGGVFDALVASSGHRANMLGDFTHVGIGVWVDGSGTLWTAHVLAG